MRRLVFALLFLVSTAVVAAQTTNTIRIWIPDNPRSKKLTEAVGAQSAVLAWSAEELRAATRDTPTSAGRLRKAIRDYEQAWMVLQNDTLAIPAQYLQKAVRQLEIEELGSVD